MENILVLFKNKHPSMQAFAGQDRIFFQRLCTGNSISYTVNKINLVFEQGKNPESLMERMVSLMIYLQQGYHNGKYEGIPAQYKDAQTEYPQLYFRLVQGLDESTLQKIKDLRHDVYLPNAASKSFVRILEEDRQKIQHEASNDNGSKTSCVSGLDKPALLSF